MFINNCSIEEQWVIDVFHDILNEKNKSYEDFLVNEQDIQP